MSMSMSMIPVFVRCWVDLLTLILIHSFESYDSCLRDCVRARFVLWEGFLDSAEMFPGLRIWNC
jgi:hypothetical protein